uniref:Phage lysozyme 2 n=1 Tax=Veneroida sp. wenbei TaxID=1739612 RepID=A0A1N7TAU7_9BIVA|nr:phage lysozyme 2 [Veneroida sp. wenbei]
MRVLIFIIVPVLSTAVPDKRYLLDNYYFTCDNGERVHGSAKCNTYNDCTDFSDEIKCYPAWFLCEFGDKTIPASWRCDGKTDCADHKDESGCGYDYFTCNNGQQIRMKYRCNFYTNCMDGSDEKQCYFTCDNGQRIDKKFECDTYRNCSDRSDEKNCSRWYFNCRDGLHIAQSFRCNVEANCYDKSDEEHCGTCELTASDVSAVKAQLKIDEGYETKICNDNQGNLTLGIGHHIKASDPEYGKPVGTSVSADRINEAFTGDFNASVAILGHYYPLCFSWPSEVKLILVNIAFNLGNRQRKYPNPGFNFAMEEMDWDRVANEMELSVWFNQTGGTRAADLVSRMRTVEE